MLGIDKFSRVPIYEQIVSQIETHIMLGEYKPEQALPSVRALAVELGINPNTLQKAYAELERKGLCQSAPGSGRFVSRDAVAVIKEQAKMKLEQFKSIAGELIRSGITKEELVEALKSITVSLSAPGREGSDEA